MNRRCKKSLHIGKILHISIKWKNRAGSQQIRLFSMDKIKQSEVLINWINGRISTLKNQIEINDRNEIVLGCFDTALELQKAVLILTANRLYGASFPLIRIIFEAWIRSLWFCYCAAEKDIEEFKNKNFNRSIGILIKDIEKIEGYNIGTITRIKTASWDAMNCFIHVGYSQIERRFRENRIAPNYDLDEINESIDFANIICLFCCLPISIIAGDRELLFELVDRVKSHKKYNDISI
jgi:hypothetical protein